MSTEQNKTIVRQRINEEMISQNRLDLVDEIFAESFVDHSAMPGLPANREGVKMFFGALHAALSGLYVTVEDQVAEGDKVVTRKTFHGTHTGDFFGIPATGRNVSFQVIDILRLQDGWVTDHCNVVDQLSLMRQLEAIPELQPTTA
jgi:predicted ester cyclase